MAIGSLPSAGPPAGIEVVETTATRLGGPQIGSPSFDTSILAAAPGLAAVREVPIKPLPQPGQMTSAPEIVEVWAKRAAEAANDLKYEQSVSDALARSPMGVMGSIGILLEAITAAINYAPSVKEALDREKWDPKNYPTPSPKVDTPRPPQSAPDEYLPGWEEQHRPSDVLPEYLRNQPPGWLYNPDTGTFIPGNWWDSMWYPSGSALTWEGDMPHWAPNQKPLSWRDPYANTKVEQARRPGRLGDMEWQIEPQGPAKPRSRSRLRHRNRRMEETLRRYGDRLSEGLEKAVRNVDAPDPLPELQIGFAKTATGIKLSLGVRPKLAPVNRLALNHDPAEHRFRKDRKSKHQMAYMAMLKMVNKVWGDVSEGLDLLQAALMGFSWKDSGRQVKQWKDVYYSWDDVDFDMGKFLMAYVKMEVTDRLIAQLSKAQVDWLRKNFRDDEAIMNMLGNPLTWVSRFQRFGQQFPVDYPTETAHD